METITYSILPEMCLISAQLTATCTVFSIYENTERESVPTSLCVCVCDCVCECYVAYF